MSNYSQNVFFAPKDSLTTGDPNKVIKGSEIDAELQEISDAIATKVETGGVPSGTKMVFIETVAPSGWTLNTAYDDMTILISDGPTNDGTPDTGGNWTLSGISVSTAAAHTHGAGTLSGSYTGTAGAAAGVQHWVLQSQNITVSIAGSTASGGSHSHSLSNSSWRPSYVQAIICSKD